MDDVVKHAVEHVAPGVVTAIAGFLGTLLVSAGWAGFRGIGAWVLSHQGQQLIGLVSAAGLQAATAGVLALRGALAQAKAADSDGGADVTPAERDHALSVAVQAGIAVLKNSGVFGKVLAIYGGQDAVEAALKAKALEKMDEFVRQRILPASGK